MFNTTIKRVLCRGYFAMLKKMTSREQNEAKSQAVNVNSQLVKGKD